MSAPGVVSPTPTIDRLAEPTLPANPSQADDGAQQYWFQCLPCHGDRGQGLTDEFRSLYPPEEQNCWESGCHGPRFYENGWTIPKNVPALVGASTLQKFPDASVLQAYIKAAMPFQWPGTLDDETAWALTAFILRENGLWDASQPLGAGNASAVLIRRGDPAPLVTATLPLAPTPLSGRYSRPGSSSWWIFAGAALSLLAVFFAFLQRGRK